MTSSERVRKAVLFRGPDRIPYDLPEKWGTDFVYTGPDEDPNWKPSIKTDLRWEDEWGSIWEKLPGDKTMGQPKVHPLADYGAMKTHRFPDYKNPQRYRSAQKTVAENKAEKFVMAGIPLSLIHRLEYLRGHAAGWTDPYLHADEFEVLLDKLAGIAIDSIERLGAAGVNGVIFCDDWGLQDRLMVKPAVFAKYWKPRYARIFQTARAKGVLTFMHSCCFFF